jgi:outer membrane protein assembly factor BamB
MKPLSALCSTILIAVVVDNMKGSPMNDWPQERHDAQMTGRTSAKGAMSSPPTVRYRHYLGLWTNHLVATTRAGATATVTLPDQEFGETYRHDHALEWALRQPQVEVDGMGGALPEPNASSEKIAKLLPDTRGRQRVVFDNAFAIGAEANYGRLYAYDEGVDKPRLVWQTERVKDMYAPVVCIVDTDLDGQDEVALLTHYHLAIYDALTGQEKDSIYWNVGRNYGQLTVVDADGDGRPDFVVQADAPPHLEFIRNAPEGLQLKWSHKYLKNEADVAVPTDFFLHNLPNAVGDLDGDGRVELAVNIRHFNDDKRWHIVVFDVLTGDVKADIVDRYLYAVADLDRDGAHEFLMTTALDLTIDRDLPLTIGTYRGTTVETRWESAVPGRFCTTPYRFPKTANSASTRGPVHHSKALVADVDGDGNDECFASTVDGTLYAIGSDGDAFRAKWSLTSPSSALPPTAIAASSDAPARVLVELPAESGVIRTTGVGVETVSHYRAGRFRTTPSVADLDADGRNEIIAESADGHVNVFDVNGGVFNRRWRVRAAAQPVSVTWKGFRASVPAVDLDGDGQNEILCCDNGAETATTLYAYRADGTLYWKSELPELAPRLTETFRVGRFRSEGPDVVVVVQPTTQPEMFCLDGRTGAVRWHKASWTDAQGQVWPYPNRFVCADVDGDGLDEVYGSYAYMFYALDGATGEPMRKVVNIWHEVYKRWQAYFYPVPADYDGDGKPEFLLASDSFAIGGVTVMSPTCDVRWEVPLDNARGAKGLQAVGDVDGDGLPEVAYGCADGRVICYDGRTAAVRWEVPNINGSGAHFTSGDIDGDGRDEFIYPLATGEIAAFDNDAEGHVLWRVHVSGTSDTPVLADVDGDGLVEIVVCTEDGYLNVLK